LFRLRPASTLFPYTTLFRSATKEIVDDVFESVNDRKKAIKTLYIARSAIKHNMKDDLKDIQTPVCLIWGNQDNVTPPEVAVEFRSEEQSSELQSRENIVCRL